MASRNVVLATNMWGNVDAEISVTSREQKLAAEFVKPAPPAFVRDPMKIYYPGEVRLVLIPVMWISCIQYDARIGDTIASNAEMFLETSEISITVSLNPGVSIRGIAAELGFRKYKYEGRSPQGEHRYRLHGLRIG